MGRLIIPLVLLGLAVVLFTSFTQPIVSDIQELRSEAAVFQNAIANARELQTIRDDLLEQYNALDAASVARLNKALPGNAENIRLIMDIDAIAQKYGIGIRDIGVREVTEGSGGRAYNAATLSFSFSGPYAALKLFLTDLAASLRLVDVTSLSFTAGDRDFYDYAMTVRAYWLK